MNEGEERALRRPTAWERLERRLLVIASTLALAVIASYVGYHWGWRGAGFGNPDAWGAFGDYFGGTINPLLGLFTLALLLATLNVTRRVRDDTAAMMDDQRKALVAQQDSMNEQINLLRVEAQERQLKSKLETIEGRLAAALEAWRELCDKAIIYRKGGLPINLRSTLYSRAGWGDFKTRNGYSSNSQSDERWMDKAKKALSIGGGAELKNLVSEFAQYCCQYEEAGGNKLVTDFYRSRLAQPLLRLTSIAYVEDPVARYLQAPNRVFQKPVQGDESRVPGPDETQE